MPFGVAVLAHNLDTPNRKWGVFYFGICLFGSYWTTIILGAFVKFKFPISYISDLPIPAELMQKATVIFMGATALLGAVLVSVSLFFPWAALVGYGIYVLSNVSPVHTFNRSKPLLEKILTR
jgi:hypothetical protein